MVKLKSKHLKNFSNSNWVITLFSTMVGVFLGIYLNNYTSRQELLEKKDNALASVSQELDENKITLEEYSDILDEKFDDLNYLFSKLNADKKILIHKDSLNSFKKKTSYFFNYETFTQVSNSIIEIRGSLNLHIGSKLILLDLSHIIWDSYKQTEYLSETGFKCITEIESIYSTIKAFNEVNDEWRKLLLSPNFLDDKNNISIFMNKWSELKQRIDVLKQILNAKEELLSSCD